MSILVPRNPVNETDYLKNNAEGTTIYQQSIGSSMEYVNEQFEQYGIRFAAAIVFFDSPAAKEYLLVKSNMRQLCSVVEFSIFNFLPTNFFV